MDPNNEINPEDSDELRIEALRERVYADQDRYKRVGSRLIWIPGIILLLFLLAALLIVNKPIQELQSSNEAANSTNESLLSDTLFSVPPKDPNVTPPDSSERARFAESPLEDKILILSRQIAYYESLILSYEEVLQTRVDSLQTACGGREEDENGARTYLIYFQHRQISD